MLYLNVSLVQGLICQAVPKSERGSWDVVVLRPLATGPREREGSGAHTLPALTLGLGEGDVYSHANVNTALT